ncbi:ribonuclease H-like domain-containing protein [Tanacetum coccineum]
MNGGNEEIGGIAARPKEVVGGRWEEAIDFMKSYSFRLSAVNSSYLLAYISRDELELSMTNLGPLNYYMDNSITRTTKGMILCKKKYAVEVLKCARMPNCHSNRTSIDTESKLGADSTLISDLTLYRSLDGALQYLTFAKPDLSYAVQQVCSFMLCDLDFEPLSLSLSFMPFCDLVSFTNILILCLILKASNQS